MRTLAIAVLTLLLAACSQKYKLDSYQPPQQRLSQGSAIYVMVPADGRYGNITYSNSGQQTAQALFASLATVSNKIEVAPKVEPLAEALANAKSKGATYVFQPQILNWIDRATEWSGIPDRITIKLIVYEVESGKDVASVMSRASSKWGTLGGDHPQDLLPRVMAEFTKLLF